MLKKNSLLRPFSPVKRVQPGTVAERRIHAAVDPHNLTSCRINPAFLPKRCDWIFSSIIKVRTVKRHAAVFHFPARISAA
jgi:hypothetical protein